MDASLHLAGAIVGEKDDAAAVQSRVLSLYGETLPSIQRKQASGAKVRGCVFPSFWRLLGGARILWLCVAPACSPSLIYLRTRN